MSAAESRAAIDRLAEKRKEHGAEDFGAYAFLMLGILGWHQPDVLTFLLDRADERLNQPQPAASDAAVAAGVEATE